MQYAPHNKINIHLAENLPANFLSSVGHELRNPLATVLAQAEMLLDGVHGPLSASQTAALRSIHDQTRLTAALISDLVDVARLSSESLTLITCDLSEAVENSLTQIIELAASRSIQISSTFSSDATVKADPARLRQMLGELFAAAVVATPTGGQTRLLITAEEGSILVQAISNAALPLPLHDNTPDDLLRQHTQLKPIGFALLAVLTRLHHGQFTLSAAAGHASLFSLRLPSTGETLSSNEIPSPIIQTAPVPCAPTPSAHQKTILIADDQKAFVSVTCGYLEGLGFEVITALDGSEAVRLALKLLPDLIFMDVRMPILDGLSAIREIRAATSPKLHAIPIISLSGCVGAIDQEKCLAAGATSYLGKPFGVREIDRIIQDYLQPAPP